MPRFGFEHAASALLLGTAGLFALQQVNERPAYSAPVADRQARVAPPLPSPTASVVATATTLPIVAPEPTPAPTTPPTVEPTAAPTAIPTSEPTPQAAVAPTPSPEPDVVRAAVPVAFESGIASTYGAGDGFEGRRTACGQIFHTQIVQVAHKSLPCGTRIRIEDAATGRSVIAEVTDRGPYVTGRIVDLSWAAMRELTPSAGLLRVNVYLETDDG